MCGFFKEILQKGDFMCGSCEMGLKQMKICNRCRQEKDLEKFYINRKSKDGRFVSCKECILKQWRKPTKED